MKPYYRRGESAQEEHLKTPRNSLPLLPLLPRPNGGGGRAAAAVAAAPVPAAVVLGRTPAASAGAGQIQSLGPGLH